MFSNDESISIEPMQINWNMIIDIVKKQRISYQETEQAITLIHSTPRDVLDQKQ